MVAGSLLLSLWSHGVVSCLSLSHCCWLSLTVSPIEIELLHVSYSFLWLLAVSHCISGPIELLQVFNCLLCLLEVSYFLSGPMELLHVSHCLSDPMELLHVSHCLSLLLAVSHFLSGPMELLHVSHCLEWLLTISMVPWSCCMSLTVTYVFWLSITVSTVT